MDYQNSFDKEEPNFEGLSPEDVRALQMYYIVKDDLTARGSERGVPDEVVVYDSGGVRICGNGQDFEFTKDHVDEFLGIPTNGNGLIMDPAQGSLCYRKPIDSLQTQTKYGARQELKTIAMGSMAKFPKKFEAE